MATKVKVSKRDIESVKSIIKKTYTGVIPYGIISHHSDTYFGRYRLSTGSYDYMSVCFEGTDSYFFVNALKDTFCDRIDSYRIVSIQRMPYGSEEMLVNIRPTYCGFCDPVIKELFITYLSTCPDKHTYDKMLDIKFLDESSEDEIEDDEIVEEEISEDASAEAYDTDIDEVISNSKSDEFSIMRMGDLLTSRRETLDNIMNHARSYINGMYRNFKYEIQDMLLSCSSKEEYGGNTTIRDYIACRVRLKYINSLKYEISMFYIVVRDEQFAESLIYI